MSENDEYAKAGTILGNSLVLTWGTALLLAAAFVTNVLLTPPPFYFPLSTFEASRVLQNLPVARDNELIVRTVSTTPPISASSTDPSARAIVQAISTHLGIPPQDVRFQFDQSWGLLTDAGMGAAQRKYDRVILDDARMYRDDPRFSPLIFGGFQASMRQSDGSWVTVSRSNEQFTDGWQFRLITFLGLMMSLLVPPVWIYSRQLARPIRRFAAAADRLGRGGFEQIPIKGPREIRIAAIAMNDMQQRLERYMRERTAMIGAVAHDLRTPLARMAFIMADAPEGLRTKVEKELEGLERMIAVTLDFVHSEAIAPKREPIDLRLLIEGVIDDFSDRGGNANMVLHDAEGPITVLGDQLLLTRLFSNLVNNALNYGGDAQASLRRFQETVVVEIADSGPGMDQADLAHAFEPFFRAERSRSLVTGGMGLGLSIVASIAKAHGGTVCLVNRPEGGLIARVTLPINP
jgi:two-component system, OmpR family, sensor kinase